jgi:hypothetical protein
MRTLGKRLANDEPITVSDADWRQHQYVIGASGSGKTNFLETLMLQDLGAGRGFCFIDKHGDSAKRIADSADQPIIYWKPADLSYVIGLNPLQNVAPDERWKVTADIVSVFSDIWLRSGDAEASLLFARSCSTFARQSGHNSARYS